MEPRLKIKSLRAPHLVSLHRLMHSSWGTLHCGGNTPHISSFAFRQGLTLVPISAQLEFTLPLSAQLELTLSSL